MFIAIPVIIIAILVAYSLGSSSKQHEVDELKEEINEIRSKLEEEYGENWEEDIGEE